MRLAFARFTLLGTCLLRAFSTAKGATVPGVGTREQAVIDLERLTSLDSDSAQGTALGLEAGGEERKRIAVVGAGSAGLGTLKVLRDVAAEKGLEWNIVAFEQRSDVGGIW